MLKPRIQILIIPKLSVGLFRLNQIKKKQQDLSQFFGEQFLELVQEMNPHIDTAVDFMIDDSSNILYLLLLEKDSHAYYFLQTHGVSRSEVMKYLIKQNLVNTKEEELSSSPFKNLKTLNKFSIDLVEKAAKGKTDPLIGRKNEVQRIIHLLCRRKKNNPLLVGEPGVGKSALIEGLAYRIHTQDVRCTSRLKKCPYLQFGFRFCSRWNQIQGRF